MANISFMHQHEYESDFLDDRLRKIRRFTDSLVANFKEAWNPEQFFTIDESMIEKD
jgi:hypothetical protein